MKRHLEYERALGNKIKKLREDKKLSQGELGYLAGVSQNQISRLENATGGVTVYSLISIAAALGCDPSELIKVNVKLELDGGKNLSLIKRFPITPILRRVLASDFLLTPRSIKEISEYCKSELDVTLRSGSISGALKRLADKELVHRLPAPKKGDFLYQKIL